MLLILIVDYDKSTRQWQPIIRDTMTGEEVKLTQHPNYAEAMRQGAMKLKEVRDNG